MKVTANLTNYLSSVIAEFRKVSFPPRRDILAHTSVVVAAIILVVVFLTIVDGVLGILVKLLFTNV